MVDDFINVYESGEGRLIVINVNGETVISKIKKHAAFKLFSSEQKDALIRREVRSHA